MFPVRYFAPRYFPQRYFPALSLYADGLEYTFNTNRLHFSVSNKSHYNLPIDRIHYNIEDKE